MPGGGLHVEGQRAAFQVGVGWNPCHESLLPTSLVPKVIAVPKALALAAELVETLALGMEHIHMTPITLEFGRDGNLVFVVFFLPLVAIGLVLDSLVKVLFCQPDGFHAHLPFKTRRQSVEHVSGGMSWSQRAEQESEAQPCQKIKNHVSVSQDDSRTHLEFPWVWEGLWLEWAEAGGKSRVHWASWVQLEWEETFVMKKVQSELWADDQCCGRGLQHNLCEARDASGLQLS